MKNPGFDIVDLISMTFWLFVILVFAYLKRQRNREKSHYIYYLPNLWCKLLMGMIFAMVYLLYYNGGDTTAYWDGGVKLMNLFFKDPLMYFDQMFGKLSWENYRNYYDENTGYPPSWIYKEKEGFFVCKVVSIFSFFTGKSYLAITLLFSFFVSEASWKLFELFRAQKLTSDKNAAIAALFIPSVNFWCTGIMKDTIVLLALMYILYFLHELVYSKHRSKIFSLIMMSFFVYLVYNIRTFILVSLLPPLFITIGNTLAKYVKNWMIRVIFVRFAAYVLGISISILYFNSMVSFGSLSSDKLIQTAVTTQQDFASNVTYGDNRYDIGYVDGSYASLLRVAPLSILAGLYRPYIWEAQSLFMLLNGVESIVLIYFTLRFIFSRNLPAKMRAVSQNQFLLFSFVFVLILAYFVGFTSGLFGTLVRFKAPLLPFFAFLMLSGIKTKKAEALPSPVI